jgi:HK97 family phage prohead protease
MPDILVIDVDNKNLTNLEPGAFSASLLQRKRDGRGFPPMLKMHGAAMGAPQEPIGVWEDMTEDQHGLCVKGRLIGMDTEQGRWNYAQLRDGALRGLSIGFKTRNFRRGSGKAGEPARYLKAVDLLEVSLVDDPANALAQVYSFKSGFNPREVETALRDAGFSRAEAVKGAAVFREYLCRDGEGPTPEHRDDAAAADLVAAIKRATSTLIPTRR